MDLKNFPAVNVLLKDVLKSRGLSPKLSVLGLERLVSDYGDLDVISRRKLRQGLRLLEMDNVAQVLETRQGVELKETGFACPVLKMEVLSSCENTNCRYNFKTASHNCVLVESNNEPMKDKAVGDLLGITSQEVRSITKVSLGKMRGSAIGVAQSRSELRPEFVFFKNTQVCAECERSFDGEAFYEEDCIRICSPECYSVRDPAQSVLEAKYGVPAAKLATWAHDNFDDIHSASEALGFSATVLTRALGK